ncbi:MAG: hypothetical protein AAFZ89_12400 [Bacteroidota bacterium]
MKKITLLFVLSTMVILSCKTEKKPEIDKSAPELSILEKVAHAHGYENWKFVEELRFTFNVDRDSSHFERKWVWKPRTNEVSGISNGDTVIYNRNAIDSLSAKVDAAFINDKYWLLAPFNLIWDKNNIEYEHTTGIKAPISDQIMQKLTIVYGNEGGYTPGDAYDFYFDKDYLLKEWVFRKENQAEPSMTTTWEAYEEKEGLQFGTMHKKAEENFKLYLSGITLKTIHP